MCSSDLKTPPPTLDRLNQEISRIMRRADIVERFAKDAVDTLSGTRAEFAAIVRSDPTLRARWGTEADRLLRVAEEAVAPFDEDFRSGPGPDEGHLVCPYLKKPLPLNMQNALARAWLALADATGDARYRERVTKLAVFFRQRIRTEGDGAATWAYWPPLSGTNDTFEDISHASINVDFMDQCHEHGIVFTREDLERVGRTFTLHVMLADDRIDRKSTRLNSSH